MKDDVIIRFCGKVMRDYALTESRAAAASPLALARERLGMDRYAEVVTAALKKHITAALIGEKREQTMWLLGVSMNGIEVAVIIHTIIADTMTDVINTK